MAKWETVELYKAVMSHHQLKLLEQQWSVVVRFFLQTTTMSESSEQICQDSQRDIES